MIKLILTATTLLISGIAFADVPNTFEAGSAIKASEMNENFTSINNDVNTISDEISDLDSKTANYSDLETDVASLKAKVELLETSLASDDSITTAEFVGVTTAITTGAAGGRFGMNQICTNEYPDARICLVSEVRAVDPGAILSTSWIDVPDDYSIAGWGGPNGGTSKYYSGIDGTESGSRSFSCYDWSDQSSSFNKGAILLTTGRRSLSRCHTGLSVACCK